MLHTRWTLLEMRKDALPRGLPAPDEAYARHHCLQQGVEAPDLATIKEFVRFYIATSSGRIVMKSTVDSIANTAGLGLRSGSESDLIASRVYRLIELINIRSLATIYRSLVEEYAVWAA
jgi:hypothetical protein